MALFRTKKEDEQTPQTAAPSGEKKSANQGAASPRDLARVLIAPRITEKATIQSGRSVYVFDVDSSATKHDIMDAIERYYKVRPVKVNITPVPSKVVRNRRLRGKGGTKGGGKKAYVYLPEGESISII